MQKESPSLACEQCHAPLGGPNQKRFCSRRCAAHWRALQPEFRQKVSAHRKAYFEDPAHRREISERQKARYANPANRPWGQVGGERTSHPASVRQTRSARIRQDRPWQLGGNGRPRSWRQEKLANALGAGWISEDVVVTGDGWLPHAYKIDVAHEALKIAIEVGNVASPRKREWYAQNGWTYLHFSNRMVETWMDGCLQMVASTTSKLKATTTT